MCAPGRGLVSSRVVSKRALGCVEPDARCLTMAGCQEAGAASGASTRVRSTRLFLMFNNMFYQCRLISMPYDGKVSMMYHFHAILIVLAFSWGIFVIL